MRIRKHNLPHRITTCIIVMILVTIIVFQLIFGSSGTERYFSGAAEDYYQSLLRLGFPSDYATQLTELHLLHPNWSFTPLLVTDGNARYTWDYVIDKETDDPSLNLISSASAYKAYRHATNLNTYDSGHYQASRAAVEYFMDPRNFLNESDLFLFFDLSATNASSSGAVSAILHDTFMDGAMLENGKSYASYFIELGDELGVSPVYIATKVRQEQGVNGTSPIISGKCGTKLWDFYDKQTQKNESGSLVKPPSSGYTQGELLALNGYYNYFNIGASGDGVFSIYRNAMNRAIKGTASKASAWGGSPSWNTRWKAIYGGAYFLKTSYIDCYQSTVYLQKFNVDSRSNDNFEHQYMQSVTGGLSEARILYQSLASADALDNGYNFLIPVYDNMPSAPSSDPANGSCLSLAPATARYSYRAELTSPLRHFADDSAIYTEHELYAGSSFHLSGVVTHDYGIRELQYAWDGGAWQTASSDNQMDFSLSADFSEGSTHILVIRGKAAFDSENSQRKSNAYFLCAVIYVKVTAPPSVTLTFRVGNTETERSMRAGSMLTLPESDAPEFIGWLASDGTLLPSGAECTVSEALTYTAMFADFRLLDGAALATAPSPISLRFSAVLDNKTYKQLSPYFQLSATVTGADFTLIKTEVRIIEHTSFGEFVRLDVNTPSLSPSQYGTDFEVVFEIDVRYSNGETKTIYAEGESTPRSARFVAQTALHDTTTQYSTAVIDRFNEIVQASEGAD